jgi:hypothetical protein
MKSIIFAALFIGNYASAAVAPYYDRVNMLNVVMADKEVAATIQRNGDVIEEIKVNANKVELQTQHCSVDAQISIVPPEKNLDGPTQYRVDSVGSACQGK